MKKIWIKIRWFFISLLSKKQDNYEYERGNE